MAVNPQLNFEKTFDVMEGPDGQINGHCLKYMVESINILECQKIKNKGELVVNLKALKFKL